MQKAEDVTYSTIGLACFLIRFVDSLRQLPIGQKRLCDFLHSSILVARQFVTYEDVAGADVSVDETLTSIRLPVR